MTSFISAISKKYFVSAAVCIVIAEIYFLFSHGVRSNYMLLSFTVPLAAGVISLLAKTAFGRKMCGSAAACLTVGLFLKGIFDISGGTFGYEVYYYIAAAVFAGLFILAEVGKYVLEREREREHKHNNNHSGTEPR
ncbi:hypothetical protein FACS1894120_0970 [Clostridia bacterium]|nr:hypothetical protein FACS1894120_0970 [Clostridia bacterium]